MDNAERLENERRIIRAAQGGEASSEAVNSLYTRAHAILGNRHLSSEEEIAGVESRVSKCFSTQTLDDKDFDVYVSSGKKEERVRFLLLEKGEKPENVLKDGTFIATKGENGSGRAILMFDPHETGLLEDANNGFDVRFIHSVITDIKKQSDKILENRKEEARSTRNTILGWLTFGLVMYAPQNVIGERHTPFYVPFPGEIGVDLFNQPDHKATSFEEPDVPVVEVNQESDMPQLSSYDTSDAPSTWFTNDSGSSQYHDGDKPGLWRLDLGKPGVQSAVYDKDIVESGIQATFDEFDCSSAMSGAECIESLRSSVEDVERSSSRRCSKFDIEITPDAKLFTTSDQVLTYVVDPLASLEVCSEIGKTLSGTNIYVYNEE